MRTVPHDASIGDTLHAAKVHAAKEHVYAFAGSVYSVHVYIHSRFLFLALRN